MRRRLTFIACSFAAALVLAAGVALAAEAPQPGQWEIASKTERSGVVKTRPLRTICITPEKAREFGQTGRGAT